MKRIFLLAALTMIVHLNAQLTPMNYADCAQLLNGFAAKPSKALKGNPGILVLPAWKGIDKHAKDVAGKLAALGYHAFVADIYGVGNYPKDTKEAGERAGSYKKNILQYQNRIALALDQLIKSGADKDKIVVIGYCFGGTGAIEAARAGMNVKGIVSFHGGLGKDPNRKVALIKTKLLICHGANDPYESPEEITAFQQEMRDANADWQMIYYSGAVHAFTDADAGNDPSKGVAYNATADERSWQHFMTFLKEVLQ